MKKYLVLAGILALPACEPYHPVASPASVQTTSPSSSSSGHWVAARPDLTQQAFAHDQRRCMLLSAPYIENNILAALSTMTLCMEDHGWAWTAS
jgi:hypothetical protein